MNVLKKNLILTVVLAGALLLALFLGFRIHLARTAAAEAEGQVEVLRRFSQEEKRRTFSSSNENLEIAQRNYDKARRELENFRLALHQNSRVNYNRRVTNTQCKNHLIEGTRALVTQLVSARGMRVDQAAQSLSFGDVISAERLPDEATEVPILMKQFEIVREIVKLIAESDIRILESLRRLGGIGVASQDEFELMPFSLVVAGDSLAIRRLLTTLQHDSQYFFILRNVKFTAAPPEVAGAVGMLDGDGMDFGRPGMSPPPLRTPSPARRSRSRPGEQTAEEPPRTLTPDERKIIFPAMVTADIRFDFVEFKNPVEEN